MPALITHYVQACDVFENIHFDDVNKDAFCLGAQGPDFLYFHKLLFLKKKYREIGVRLHALKSDDIFTAFAEYISQHPDDNVARSYSMGFICHYSLDSIAHPYVYNLQNEIVKAEDIRYNPFFIHTKIEHILDIIMLRDKLEMITGEFNPKQCITNDSEILQKCAAMMKFVIEKLDGEPVDEKQLIKAFRDFRFYEGLSHDPHSWKYTLTRIAETIFLQPKSASTFIRPMLEDGAYDYSNFNNGEWENPFDEGAHSCTDSFFDLFDRSVAESAALIKKFCNAVDNNMKIDFTGNLSFKTGLEEK